MSLFPLNRRRLRPEKHCWGMCNPTCPACCTATRDTATRGARHFLTDYPHTAEGR